MVKACYVGLASLGFVLALASPGESGPALRFGSFASNGLELACLAGVNAEWSRGEVICQGTGLPAISAIDLFLHDDLTQDPFLTMPVTDPFGPSWRFPLMEIPAAAGHAFDRGNIHVNLRDLTGQSAASVRLGTPGSVRIRSEIPGSDGLTVAELNSIFPDGFESGDTSTWCGEVIIPNDGRSVGDVKVKLAEVEYFFDGSFIPLVGDLTKRSAFECFTSTGAAFNPRDPFAPVLTEITFDDETLTGTRAPCTTVESIDSLIAGTELPATLCLDRNRFQTEVAWEDDLGRQTPAFTTKITDTVGDFSFLNLVDGFPNELVVNVVDRCAVNSMFWVFVGGVTNIEYDLTMTDTASGESRSYTNPLGELAEPVQDTTAFATCP